MLEISKILGKMIDRESTPIQGFYEPLVTCSFIDNDNIYFSVYHRMQMKQYYFVYTVSTK